MELQTTLIPLCGEMFVCIMHMCIALLEHFLTSYKLCTLLIQTKVVFIRTCHIMSSFQMSFHLIL